MNASDVIDDRVVLESGNVQYVACIVPEYDPANPLKDWDQAVSFYVPHWDYENRSRKHVADLLDGDDFPNVDEYRASQALRDKTTEASWYDDTHACDWLELFRRCDPSGLYFIVNIVDDRMGYRLYWADDDDDSTHDYAIAYRTSTEIREDHMVKRITAKVRAQAEANIRAEIKTQNAYFAGEVYRYYVIREELDEEGETIDSQEIDCESWDAWGWEQVEELYEYAKLDAENDHVNCDLSPGSPGEVLYCQQCGEGVLTTDSEYLHGYCDTCWMQSDGVPSLDLFDAASYHDLSMADVAGAYEARLSAAFENLGKVTRQLEEEGYRPHAFIG